MVRYLLAFLTVILITVKLSAQLSPNTVNVIKSNNAYTLNIEGATYTVTSNGSPVNARFTIKKSTKLILDNCHILRTGSYSPITIDAANVTLEIQFRGENSLCATRDNEALPVITSASNYSPTLIFSEAPDAPASSELLLRACAAISAITPPIQFNESGTVIFRSGSVRIATSDGRDLNPYTIPALVSTNTVTLCGGSVIAQISPRSDGSYIPLKGDKAKDVTAPLFTCNNFTMTGGLLTTNGKNFTYDTNTLKYDKTPYDTYFSYNSKMMENVTSASNSSLSGGVKRSASIFSCYGLQPNTTYPAGVFTHTGTNLLEDQTTNNDGILSITNANLYPDLAFKYLDATSEALVKVFNATPMPTANGCKAEAQFGISHITIDAESLQTVLHLTLNLINDPSAVLEKTVYVRIYCTVNNEDRVMIAEQPLTFTRNAAGKPFTATFTDVSKARSASTTTRYTIEAYN